MTPSRPSFTGADVTMIQLLIWAAVVSAICALVAVAMQDD
jgi:hypothetical protein